MESLKLDFYFGIFLTIIPLKLIFYKVIFKNNKKKVV